MNSTIDQKAHPGSVQRVVRTCDVAALFCRSDSVYKTIAGVDVWDKERDARNWPGGCPVIAHPPCRAWGQLRAFARPEPGEKELALLAVRLVRENGGVLEHPARSTLWPVAGLPEPGERDKWGGWTLPMPQFWLGHRADKATRLYIVGCQPTNMPTLPLKLGEPSHVIQSRKRDSRPHVTRAEREATPKPFAEWLVEVARLCLAWPNDQAEA
jgi:hypothetical protein